MTEKVFQINVVLRPGDWCWGHYTVKGDVLTMTDQDGNPVIDHQGKTFSQKLDGESLHIAACMTKKIRLALQGKSRPGQVAGFNRPLVYPKVGIAYAGSPSQTGLPPEGAHAAPPLGAG